MRGIFTLEKSSGQGLFSVVWRQAYTPRGIFNLLLAILRDRASTIHGICISSGRLLSWSDMQCIQCSASCYSNMPLLQVPKRIMWSRTKRFTASQKVHIVQKKSLDTDMVLQAFALPFRLSQTIT